MPAEELLIWLSAAFALTYGVVYAQAPASWTRSIVKAIPVAALSWAGWLAGAPMLVVAGLALGAAGDFFLSRIGLRAFLAGMAAFAAGHVAYAAAFLDPGEAGMALFFGLPVILAAVSTETWLIPHTGRLKAPVRGYVTVIAAMMIAALSLGSEARVAVIGAGLFMLSDFLLSLELFVLRGEQPKRLLPPLVWAVYWTAQLLILTGMTPG